MKTIFNHIKSAFIFFIALVSTNYVIAQAPNKMSYQTVVRNSSNALVTGQSVGIQISILQGSASGASVYAEHHSSSTNANGLATLVVGGGTVVSGTFSTIDWSNGPYFIKTDIDPNGGSNYTITGTSELMSVPYALHAATADAIVGGSASNWTTSGNNISNNNSGNIGVGTTSPNSKFHINGSTTDPALRVQVSGNTKLVVDENGGTSIGAFATPPADGLRVAGRVGIGTSTPDAPLTIGTPGATNTNYGMTSDKRICVTNGSGGRHAAILNSTSTYALLESYNYATNTSSNVSIAGQGGSVGVGLFIPSYRLHVNGSAGKPGGGSWTNASDRRLKNQISPYKDGLSTLLTINPVTYHYNEKSGFDTSIEYVGVIAQELKEIAPYMVGSFEQDGTNYLDVNNSAMTYMLINSVKEQQSQLEALKAENATLKASLGKIEAHLGLDVSSKK